MLRLARQRARIEESIIVAPWGEGVHFFFFSNLRIYVINNSVSSQDEVERTATAVLNEPLEDPIPHGTTDHHGHCNHNHFSLSSPLSPHLSLFEL